MAKETITRFTDDLDGSGASTTVRFSFDGVGYEIDLSAGNAQSFQAAVEPYLIAGRRVTRTARRSPARPVSSAAKVDLNAIREWASANGHAVAARGRIAATIVESFHAAQHALTDPGAANGESRPTGSPRKPAAKARSGKKAAAKTAPKTGLNEIRAWAARNGYKVADRGRIPAAIIEAFHAAQAAVGDAVSPQQLAAIPAKKAARANTQPKRRRPGKPRPERQPRGRHQ
jgi:hypothetical protein